MNCLQARFIFTALLFAAPLIAHASGPACATVTEAALRLACYDRLYPPDPASTTELPQEVEIERQKALASFGLNRQQLKKNGSLQLVVDPDRLEETVVAVAHTSEGLRVISLANSQTWLLTEFKSKGMIKPGDRVTVRRAALGTFMLITSGGLPLRARRTR